jgi:hypothetical protein
MNVVPFNETVRKNIAEADMTQMRISRMRFAFWIPEATNTHSGYVMHIAFPLQQWLHDHTSRVKVMLNLPVLLFLRNFRAAKQACCSTCTGVLPQG